MPEFAIATLTATTDLKGRPIPDKQQRQRRLKVHFNPEKLELTISNAMEQNRNRRRREPPQLITESTAKLSLELVFDTTDTGSDVRVLTFQIAQMMQPRPGPRQEGEQRGVPSIVLFEWGSFVFQGYIDSYKETLDFFAPEGVPLRSTLSLSLVEQGKPFQAPRKNPVVDERAVVPTAPDRSIDGFARDLGVSRAAAKEIARDNGIENTRLPGVDQIAVPPAPPPRQPPPLAAPGATPSGVGAAPDALRAPPGLFAGGNRLAANGPGAGPLAAFGQLRTPPEIGFEAPRLDFDEALGAGTSASLDLRAGIGTAGTATASAGFSTGATGGLGGGGGIVADVGAAADAAIIIEEA